MIFMKCPKCGQSIPADSRFCQYCRAVISSEQRALVASEKKTGGVVCPRCGSHDLQVVSEVKGKGVDSNMACCGGLSACFICGPLCAPLGALIGCNGAGEVRTEHLWVCKNCAMKFKL